MLVGQLWRRVDDDYNVVYDYYYADADTRDVCLDWLPTALWETELLEVDAAVDWSSMIVHMHMVMPRAASTAS